jgi:hypothetical protein
MKPKTHTVRIEEKEFFIEFCSAQGTACSSSPQLILGTLVEQGVPTLAREESKGYLGPVVIMEKKFSARLRAVAVVLAVICLGASACKRRAEAPPGTATPSQQSPSLEIRPSTGPKTMEPATVGREKESFANYIHFPKDAADATAETAVQFYCDVSAEGEVTTQYALIGNLAPFKAAVQSALDWGRFKPAKIDGEPVAVYLGGTVLFLRQNGQPVIVVSLATADRERVGRLANYIQPQLVGGLTDRLHRMNSTLMWNRPWSGAAEVLFKINEHGEIQSSSIVSEIPKDSGLGDLLQNMTKDAQWIPAYDNVKPAAGQINVVVNFGEY